MTYTVLARKYRPQTFADLVGQEHVTRTLGNAIAQNRVAHAFLFTGVRGVGKTTSARILAKALNCLAGSAPTATPCNQCAACTEIATGTDVDVLEIDGASNNGVDDIRRLQETIPFRPQRDRFKVVIVDEVHMLSTGAFNALLKTLEEPPAHVKFIFATTEGHKVPITIRSRCQRYDFRLISNALIADRVRAVLKTEGIAADEGAISIVAREANGSLRDALTLLDMAIAANDSGAPLEGASLATRFGLADRTALRALAHALLSGDGAKVLDAIASEAERGADFVNLSKTLSELFRDLTVLKVVGSDTPLVELSAEERAELVALIRDTATVDLERIFTGVAQLVDDVAGSSVPRPVLEMGLIRIALRPPALPIAAFLSRLEGLEARLRGGGETPVVTHERRVTAPAPPAVRTAPRVAEPPKAASRERRDAPVNPPPQPKDDEPSAAPERTSFITAIGTPSPVAPTAPASATPTQPTAVVPTESAEVAQEITAATVPDKELWNFIVERIREARAPLAAILDHALPLSVTRTEVMLGFPESSFFFSQAREPDSLKAFRELLATILGGAPKLEMRGIKPTDAPPAMTLAQQEAGKKSERRASLEQRARSHPRVTDAMRVFDTDKIEVSIDEEPRS